MAVGWAADRSHTDFVWVPSGKETFYCHDGSKLQGPLKVVYIMYESLPSPEQTPGVAFAQVCL